MSFQQRAAHRIAAPLTPLVGRQREVAEVIALLRDGDVRLLNLIGSGGVGKTRLAIAVATEMADDFADGVVAVSLGTITDAAVVGPTIAHAFGLKEDADSSTPNQLAAFLIHRSVLLLLDGFEGVATGGALLTELLAACPGLKILVTSRVILHLSAEHLFDVMPLAHDGAAPGSADAVQLFAQRAWASTSSFALTAENGPVIAEICRRLDGLPLAIELAATRVRAFTPEVLLSRLERRLPLLTGGSRDAPAHHRTLTATIEWSYDLLEEPERRLLRSIAVFAGGCTVEAAMTVGDSRETGLLTLVDHSLLRRLDVASREPRFAMLDTVREFALDRLADSGEWDAVRRRHADWCLALLARAEAALGTRTQQQWLAPLETEHANFRAAMHMARAAGDGETLARLAGGLWSFWYARGFLTEGRLWLSDALATVGDVPGLRLKVLVGSGALAHAQGDAAAARTALEQAQELAVASDDPRARSMTLTLLGAIARDRGDYDEGEAYLRQSLAVARSVNDAWTAGMALNALAILHERRGDFGQAADVLRESASLAETAGDIWGEVHAVINMAHLLHRQGVLEPAASRYEKAASLYREIGDQRGEANALTNLGRIAERLGELDRAVELHTQSLEVTQMLGDCRGTATALANRGVAHLRRGDLGHAEADLRQSLEIRSRSGDREGIATSLEKLAEVRTARGASELAVWLWAAAAALRDAIGAPLAPSERASYDIVMTAARSLLGERRVTETWTAGRAAPLDAVVAVAAEGDGAREPVLAVVDAPASRAKATVPGLTPRELEVLRLLEEHTDREIAETLSIGSRTVATHVTNILNKLGVNTRTAAVATAIRHGLI